MKKRLINIQIIMKFFHTHVHKLWIISIIFIKKNYVMIENSIYQQVVNKKKVK